MFEIEIKVKVDDPERIKSQFEALGFLFLKKESQKDIYYKSKFQDFEKTGEVLRYRKRELNSNILTYKGPKVNSGVKVREEIEIIVDDGSDIQRFLTKLGFEPIVTVEKVRDYFRYNMFSISLDYVKNLGNFMEVELMVNERQSKIIAEQEILNLLKKLGISPKRIEQKTYFELIRSK